VTLNSGMNITYYRCPDCTEEHDPATISKGINEEGFHAYLVIPEDFDQKIAAYDPATGQPAPEVKIYYNSSDADSATAYSTLLALLGALESSMANRFDVNISPDTVFDVATEEDLTGMLFSMLMPLLLIILMFSSCMAMTAESIAGEKERGTIATLLITPIKRSELALGKIAALSIMSLLGGLCSFVGVLLALPKLMGGEAMDAVDTSVYTMGDYAMILCVILSTILVFVSLIAVLSALANSVKEASTLVSPLMLVVTVIGVSGMFGSPDKSLGLFLIPVYNSVQCISGVFSMSYEPIQIILTVAANLLTAGVFAVVLTRMFNSERVMFKK
jgi:sodium transport system permease protein